MIKGQLVDQLIDGRYLPAIKIIDTKLLFDTDEMIIDVKGNSIAEFAKYFAILFKNRLV